MSAESIVYVESRGWLFWGLDGKCYAASIDVYAPDWEVYEVWLEWWSSVETCYTD